MNKIITVLTSIILGCLLISPVKAQEKYREDKTENQRTRKLSSYLSLDLKIKILILQ